MSEAVSRQEVQDWAREPRRIPAQERFPNGPNRIAAELIEWAESEGLCRGLFRDPKTGNISRIRGAEFTDYLDPFQLAVCAIKARVALENGRPDEALATLKRGLGGASKVEARPPLAELPNVPKAFIKVPKKKSSPITPKAGMWFEIKNRRRCPGGLPFIRIEGVSPIGEVFVTDWTSLEQASNTDKTDNGSFDNRPRRFAMDVEEFSQRMRHWKRVKPGQFKK